MAFEGKRGVPDNTPVDEMWNELGEVSFKAKTAGPVSEELDGDVVIRIKHVDRELAKVSLTALSLQADTAESAWSIDSAEGERIKTATTA